MLCLSIVTVVMAATEDRCPDPPCSITKSADANTLEEIVVTGSRIRGAEAAGSKLIVIGRDQIDASGYGRVEDVLATVTQNFNRANAAVSEPEHGSFNLNHGSEVQLRGLGVGTTLTLVNGQRQGASGYQGTFVDVSSIPVSAIERIEILPEGTAALYGSDAIGGVVNIVLRRNFEGIEARSRGSATDSGATERSAALLVGHAGSRGNVLAGFQFNDSDALRCGARAYCAADADFRRFGGTDLRGFAGNPGTIVIAAVCTKPLPNGADCNQPVDVILDGRWRNLASMRTLGADAVLDYLLHTAWGTVGFGLNGTYTIDQRQQITPTAPVFDLVDTVSNPPSLRLVGNLSWSLGGWTVRSTVNYTGAYRDTGSVSVRKVDSWTTVDVNIGYRIDGGSGWLANTQSNLAINNALDQRPPFVNRFDLTSGTFGYDPANASLLGRQVNLEVVKRWGALSLLYVSQTIGRGALGQEDKFVL
jgi:outer membrane receptor protein involved in Fe transport